MLTVAVQLLSKPGSLRQLFFAEAGCGIGTKLYLAKMYFGLKETGYEISTEYLRQCGELGVNAFRWDLREKDPPWSHFDIVYISRPFKADDAEVAWETSVMEAMRPGTVLISAFTAVKPYSWPCHYRAPFRGVWLKPSGAPVETEVQPPLIKVGWLGRPEAQAGGVYDQGVSRQPHPDPLIPEPGP